MLTVLCPTCRTLVEVTRIPDTTKDWCCSTRCFLEQLAASPTHFYGHTCYGNGHQDCAPG